MGIFSKISYKFKPRYRGQNRWAVGAQWFVKIFLFLGVFALFMFDSSSFMNWISPFWAIFAGLGISAACYYLKGTSRLSLCGAWWLMPAAFVCIAVGAAASNVGGEPIEGLIFAVSALFLNFCATNFFKRFDSIAMFSFCFAFLASIAMFLGLKEAELGEATSILGGLKAYYEAPSIRGGIFDNAGTLMFAMCAAIPYCASAFMARRFSHERKILAILLFATLWYGIFSCGMWQPLACASLSFLASAYLISATPKELKFFMCAACVLSLGTWAAFAIDDYFLCRIIGDSFSDGFLSALNALVASVCAPFENFAILGTSAAPIDAVVSGEPTSGFADIMGRFGIFGALAVVCPIVVFLYKLFRLMGNTPLAVDSSEHPVDSRNKSSSAIILREHMSRTHLLKTPNMRIIRVSAMLSMVSSVFLLATCEINADLQLWAVAAIIFVPVQFGCFGRVDIKSLAVRRILGIICALFAVLFLFEIVEKSLPYAAYLNSLNDETQIMFK